MPRAAKLLGVKLFGVAIGPRGAERAFPAGSLLLARVYDGRGTAPADGTRVVVHRRRGPRVEVTTREVVTLDREFWLASSSSCIEHQTLLRPSLPLARGRFARGTEIVDIVGIVVGAWVPQTGIMTT